MTSKNQQLLTTQMHHIALQDKRQPPSARPITVGTWQSLPNIPSYITSGSSAATGDKTYFKSWNSNDVYEFSNNQWAELPSCPNDYCTIASVDNMLTAVGGRSLSPSKLYSYINNQWVEYFPPMPTNQCNTAAVYTNNTLVVAGGYNARWLTIVEILNTVNRQWSSVSSLPVEMDHPLATIYGDYVYIQTRTRTYGQEKNSVGKCSLQQLVQSQPSLAIWEIASLPVRFSSLVTINVHLLAVGGIEANDHTTNNICQYINT